MNMKIVSQKHISEGRFTYVTWYVIAEGCNDSWVVLDGPFNSYFDAEQKYKILSEAA